MSLQKQKNNKKSIRTRLFPLFIGLAMTPVIIGLLLSYNETMNLLENRVITGQKQATSAVVTMLNETVETAEQSVSIMAANESTLDANNSDNLAILDDKLDIVRDSNPQFLYTYYYAPETGMVGSTEGIPSDYDGTSRDWYIDAMDENGSTYWSLPYTDAGTGEVTVTASQAIGDMGVIGLDIGLGKVATKVAEVSFGNTGEVYVISEDGYVQMSKNDEWIGTDISKEAIFTETTDEVGYLNNADEHGGFADYYETEPALGFTVYGTVDETEMRNEIRSFLTIALLVLGISLLLAIVAAYILTKYLTTITSGIENALEKAKLGDLSIRLTGNDLFRSRKKSGNQNYKEKDLKYNGDEFHQIAIGFNDTMDSFYNTVSMIQGNSQTILDMSKTLNEIGSQTSSATEEVSETINEIAQSTGSQTHDTENTLSLMNHLADSISTIETEMGKMGTMADKTIVASGNNNTSMQEVSHNWNETSGILDDLKNDIKKVDTEIQSIEGITQIIKSISEQTNLLALNASIEAARAGEAGKGFSVVAEEIRKLAEKSNASSENINKIIQTIQGKSTAMVSTLNTASTGSQKQTEMIRQAIDSNEEVVDQVKQLVETIVTASQGSQEINKNKDNVVASLENIAASAEEISAGTEQVSSNAEEILATMQEFSSNISQLEGIAEKLKESAGHFKLSLH
ncbi:methyl-accepting chemotaxis protein [Carnobacterium sp. ISL-102]|uniref:methyl-accepting chemotaxis protein n=1 Tax=Carnobacterium sp. ISL-102 TaxID=2819142 RepID=UPI001BE926A1|nr:methyl-accepting chemotaxis protein [Carnobacterium sp. ISL-102]MBT2732029.1 methyl-accepting chemotaxis protein [Carnobacterium sp. ISL-102]